MPFIWKGVGELGAGRSIPSLFFLTSLVTDADSGCQVVLAPTGLPYGALQRYSRLYMLAQEALTLKILPWAAGGEALARGVITWHSVAGTLGH